LKTDKGEGDMIKYFSHIFAIVLFLNIGTNEVFVEISQKEKTVLPGETGTLVCKFSMEDEIGINLEPSVELLLDKDSPIILETSKLTEKIKKNNPADQYLDTTKSLEIKFTVKKNTKAGKRKVKSIIKYFYCHHLEGWCMQEENQIEFEINVGKPETKK